jgi:hypothetical protein
MPEWSDHLSIKRDVSKAWDSGRILRNALEDDGLFPLRIKLKYPTSSEMSLHFADTLDWISKLRRTDRTALGYGYALVEKEIHHRLAGKNMIPTHAIIPTLDDAVRLLDKKPVLRLYERLSGELLQEWECLRDWVLKKPLKVVELEGKCYAVLQVLRWFASRERSARRDFYLRQLDIEGVDTKFIEANTGILKQLLDIVLPRNQINLDARGFEERYGLKTKPGLIRFRVLDESLAVYGCTDISLPMEQFCMLRQVPYKIVFIVENEINFLSFPPVPNACVIFGMGYRADALKKVTWLYDKAIYYWGDIDTHGFNILSMVRAYLPHTQSFLMSEDVLLTHRSLWCEEDSQYTVPIPRLTQQEHELVCRLQTGYWGKGVRLEQERIRFSAVEDFVSALP